MRRRMAMAVGSLAVCAALLAGCGQTAAEPTSTESKAETIAATETAADAVEESEPTYSDYMKQAEDSFESGDYTNAVKNSLMAYYKTPDSSIDFSVIEKVIKAITDSNQMKDSEVIIEEYPQSDQFAGYIQAHIKCTEWNGKELSQWTDEEIFEMYQDLHDSFTEVVIPAENEAYYESQSAKKFRYLTPGDIKCNGVWYHIFSDSSNNGRNRSVSQQTEAEHTAMIQQAFGGNSAVPPANTALEDVPQEYRNALSKGLKYANQLNMSKKAIYDHLTSSYGEGFPEDAAQYAVDHMTDVDWNANALAKAEQYYYKMSMSKSAVYDQLTSSYGEQFTASEAQYAIDHLD